MRILFDLGHPAHFHLFKHTIAALKNSGHDVEIVARQKDVLLNLLDKANLTYHVIHRKKKGLVSLGWQNVKAFKITARLARKKKADFLVGTSLIVGPAARLTGAISLVFNEDNAKAVPIFAKLAYPTAHYIVTPNCLKFEDYGKKHLTYPGYHELAYLHPNRFTPNPDIFKELGIAPGEKYSLVRLVSLTAHHDIGEKGLGTEQAKTIVTHLSKHGRVFISAEKTIDRELQTYLLPTSPERIFDVMAFADMVIGDSQTMIAEAAVLGTPALRCNTFVGRLTYLEELEHKYGLTVGILPKDFDKLLTQINEWLEKPDLKQQWHKKQQNMLNDTIDLTNWILELLNKLSRSY